MTEIKQQMSWIKWLMFWPLTINISFEQIIWTLHSLLDQTTFENKNNLLTSLYGVEGSHLTRSTLYICDFDSSTEYVRYITSRIAVHTCNNSSLNKLNYFGQREL